MSCWLMAIQGCYSDKLITMITMTTPEFIKCFLFHLVIGDQKVSAASCITDPFSGTLWLARAHSKSRPTWSELLTDIFSIVVTMNDRDASPARSIEVEFDSLDWRPIHMDASKDDLAMDWVGLVGARYTLIDTEVQATRRERVLTIKGMPEGWRIGRTTHENSNLLIVVEHPSFDVIEPGTERPELEISVQGW